MGREGFGFVGLEAMAAGTPVVGYADGALPEVLGDCALLVAPGDRRALRDAILTVLREPQTRARMVECGRLRVARLFRVERTVAAMKDRYVAVDRHRASNR
jgi:glycosyltransferase involved in cell wall biosynthesis